MTLNFKFFSVVLQIFFIFTFIAPAQTPDNANAESPDLIEIKQDALPGEPKTDFGKPVEINKFEQPPNKPPELFKDGQDEEPAPADWRLRRGEKQWNVEVGYSPFQPTFFAEKEYDTEGRSFGMVSLRWGRVIGTVKNVTYEYQIEAVPLFLALKNEVRNPAFQSAAATPGEPPTLRETSYGVGFSPLGFRFLFLSKKRLKPFIALHTGFAYFSEPLPTPDSMRFNFTGDFGGGIQYQIKRDRAISFGYRYYHISNINLGERNPGYNANIFYVGYSSFYK